MFLTASLDYGCALGYIGPGAGFAFMGSFLILIGAFLLVIAAILSWPFRALFSLFLRRGKKRGRASVKRVIVLGLDGLDPRRCERMMRDGLLPSLQALAAEGSYTRLGSTHPPISPVAWASFMTGANPGKHNIFDFLNRNPHNYALELSSSRVRSTRKGRPVAEQLRKSKPFWNVLGEYGVFSTVLRVPITFPPEPFRGVSLSGMCVPDLRGTQGSFTCFTDQAVPEDRGQDEGLYLKTSFDERGRGRVEMPGPASPRDPDHPLVVPIDLVRNCTRKGLRIKVHGKSHFIREGSYTDWIRLEFRPGGTKRVTGLCRFYLKSLHPEFVLYATPLHIDPARPSLPITHPRYYAIYLAKLLGPYATLGLAEDTWAMNEGILDDEAFLKQAYDIHREREAMFLESIRRTRRGACICVFDASDRIQHMFMRHGDTHEQPHEGGVGDESEKVLDDMYRRMDDLVGRARSMLGPRDLLLVLSDHGFTSFRTGVQLNAWLREEGYLAEREPGSSRTYLRNIDWSKTQAYAFGLAGIYLNRAGREGQGIVNEADVPALKQALREKLLKLTDPNAGRPVVRNVHLAEEVYQGPYRDHGPDLVIGYHRDYRISWEGATGKTNGTVFSANTKAWSGDHCVDRDLVPGILFMNRKMEDGQEPQLMDVGPTILQEFGVPTPGYMDGHPLTLNK